MGDIGTRETVCVWLYNWVNNEERKTVALVLFCVISVLLIAFQ